MMQLWTKICLKKPFWLCLVLFIFVTSNHCFAVTEGIQIYQKNLHLSPEHKNKLEAAIYRYHTAENLWGALRRDFILPHYENSPVVQEQIAWFLNHPDFLYHSAIRAAPYLYYILQQVRKRHLPGELVLLPIIESSYNPFACSTVGAAGIWQMMPGTASGFGLKQNWWYDGRRDVVASTRAALNYLAYLGNFFEGNWLLAIAAYDTGEGNVLSAIRKNSSLLKNTDYWSLPLSQETKLYVPRLLALAVILSHPEEFAFRFPTIRNAPYLAQLDIGTSLDLNDAAYLAGLTLKTLKALNPGYNHTKIDPHGPFKLVLPIENVKQFTENLERFSFPSNLNASSKKKKKATFDDIAKRLESENNFTVIADNVSSQNETDSSPDLISDDISTESNSKSKALVYHDSVKSISKSLDNFTGNYSLEPGDTLYMVRSGDDLKNIAERFHISQKTLLAVNHLYSYSSLSPGKQLIIPTHLIASPAPQQYPLTSGNPIYMVQDGDDIENIARRFKTTVAAIRIANLLTDNKIQAGDQLVIPIKMG